MTISEITFLIFAVASLFGLFILWHYVIHRVGVDSRATDAQVALLRAQAENMQAQTENVRADTATIKTKLV